MKRFIHDALVAWKSSTRRKPLLLRGARQTGKSYSVTHFAKMEFSDKLALVDLEKHPEWHFIFDKELEPKRILADLEIALHIKIDPGHTLLFFDEIQVCPRAIMALRYFYEELPNLHVIAAGSLLEVAMGEIPFPVGRVQSLTLYPMTFVEFLWAVGKEDLACALLSADDVTKGDHEFVHQLLLDELRIYFMVGGMPEAVRTFVETHSFHESFNVHAELIHTYRDDFAKYRPHVDPHCLDQVLTQTAKSVGCQLKYSHLSEHYSSPTLKKAFDLLCRARLVAKVEATSPAGLPLGAAANPKKFKAILLDIGLMHALCGLWVDEGWQKASLLSLYNGAMAEQFVGQELLAARDGAVYYWSRESKGSSAEVDYLIEKKGEIYPIEVKSAASGRLKSLHLLLSSFPNCSEGLVFSEAKASALASQRLRFLPLYMAFGEMPSKSEDSLS